jgi:hypothetical protein
MGRKQEVKHLKMQIRIPIEHLMPRAHTLGAACCLSNDNFVSFGPESIKRSGELNPAAKTAPSQIEESAMTA